MGHKKVCIDCRESLNLYLSDYSTEEYSCTKCGRQMTVLPHRFRPPKKTDDKGWELVSFLIKHGFPFQHIYPEASTDSIQRSTTNYVPYPQTMRDAKEFVLRYKEQALK